MNTPSEKSSDKKVSIKEDSGIPPVPSVTLDNYVTTPLTVQGNEDGVPRLTPTTSVATLHIFLNDIRKQPGSPIEIVSDPEQKPMLIESMDSKISALVAALLILLSIVVGVANFVYSILTDTFLKVVLMDIYTPQRYVGTMWEFMIISVILVFYSMVIQNYPDPKTWKISIRRQKCTFKCTRIFRWIVYFFFVGYLIVILCFLCYDMSQLHDISQDKMNGSLISLTDTRLTYNQTKKIKNLWFNTQEYFQCCGINKMTDWEKVPRLIQTERKKICRYFINFTVYPHSCCDIEKYPCDFLPEKNESWSQGCLDIQVGIGYGILSLNLLLGLGILVIIVALFINIFVLEIFVLKINKPVSPASKNNNIL